MKTNPPTAAYGLPTLAVDPSKLVNIHAIVVANGCRYHLGSKVEPITLRPGMFHEVDCSGYVRWLLRELGVQDFPDGSFIQHEAVQKAGFKRSTPEALDAKDGALRIAFLKPEDGGGTGHVALWLNGQSIESHGGKGPDRRTRSAAPWTAKAFVYVLTPPVAR